MTVIDSNMGPDEKLKKILCMIRQEWVTDTPEERVRQSCLKVMTKDLGYPKGLIAVEKELSQFSHLAFSKEKIPKRRVDIVCFFKDKSKKALGGLSPLLLIECKAIKLTKKAVQQVVGYNYFVQAKFISVVNAEQIMFGCYGKEEKKYNFFSSFPSYKDLIESI